ncbi:MAG: polyprenyl synthetase family protein [Chloroflexi bacterium]|nr:polyprenyl synthetase family protein [Chloroflexota bacterium]
MTAWAVDQASLGELVDAGLTSIEEAMYQATSSEVEVLRDASRHILSAGGKRIRPRLLLLSYLALGGNDLERVAKPAAAVELMHTASVVHDDINDHGIVRRGRPSVNSIWGRTFALLTGDFLFTAVYELMAPYQHLNVDLARAATALVEGETLQASAVKDKIFTRDIYMRIIALKTAALFRAAGTIGAKLANGSSDAVAALSSFGFNLGMAFQIVDDILDLVADESTLGKSTGIDLEQGRGVAVALNDAGNSSSNGRHDIADPMDQIKRRLLEGNTIAEAREQAELLVQDAIVQLSVIPNSHYKEELVGLANLVIERDY